MVIRRKDIFTDIHKKDMFKILSFKESFDEKDLGLGR